MATETRKAFHEGLQGVRTDIVRMGGTVAEALALATDALLAGDLAAAEAIIDGDEAIDTAALELEERCYQLMVLQQPVAVDLRSLVTAVRMIAEIERSGDLVVNIMKGARRMYGTTFDPRLRGLIERLSSESNRLFRLSLDAYIDRNAALAAALDDMDDTVDRLHEDFIQAVLETYETRAMGLQPAVQLALVGRYYERIADHAVNIGDRVRFMITGSLVDDAANEGNGRQ